VIFYFTFNIIIITMIVNFAAPARSTDQTFLSSAPKLLKLKQKQKPGQPVVSPESKSIELPGTDHHYFARAHHPSLSLRPTCAQLAPQSNVTPTWAPLMVHSLNRGPMLLADRNKWLCLCLSLGRFCLSVCLSELPVFLSMCALN